MLLRVGKNLLGSSIYSQIDKHRILAHELAAGALVVAGVEVGEFGIPVELLPDEAALLGEGAGGDSLRAVGVIVECLRHFPIFIGGDVRAPEVIGVEVCGGGGGGAPTTVARSVPSGEKMCFVVVAAPVVVARL